MRLSHRILTISLIGLLAVALASCASAPHRKIEPSESTQETPVPQDESAAEETPPEDETSEEETQEPQEPLIPKKVVLVLGPAMAHGYAYAGVLRALEKSGIEVGAIFGVEMGALIGALYGFSPTRSAFEWNLNKFNEGAFTDPLLSFSTLLKKRGSGKKLESLLTQVFSDEDIADARIPLRICLRSVDEEFGEKTILLAHGSVAAAVRGSLAGGGFLEPGVWESKKAYSCALQKPFPVDEAKAMDLGPVIVVNTLELPTTAAENDSEDGFRQFMAEIQKESQGQLANADLVLAPKMEAISFRDFSKRNVAVFAGEKAVNENLSAIQSLLGTEAEQ